jgi:hypothetical protein
MLPLILFFSAATALRIEASLVGIEDNPGPRRGYELVLSDDGTA